MLIFQKKIIRVEREGAFGAAQPIFRANGISWDNEKSYPMGVVAFHRLTRRRSPGAIIWAIHLRRENMPNDNSRLVYLLNWCSLYRKVQTTSTDRMKISHRVEFKPRKWASFRVIKEKYAFAGCLTLFQGCTPPLTAKKRMPFGQVWWRRLLPSPPASSEVPQLGR